MLVGVGVGVGGEVKIAMGANVVITVKDGEARDVCDTYMDEMYDKSDLSSGERSEAVY